MREFRYYVESEPGLVLRRPPGAFYGREAEVQATTMLEHFRRVWARPELQGLRNRRFASVLAIGGGMPAFECGLHAGRITVADPLHEVYRGLEPMFRRLHPEAPPIEYRDEKADIRGGGWDCVSFSHVLEHIPLAAAGRLLARVPNAADIVIYGPNADRMRSDLWLHALPVHEHLWIGGLDWTRQWAQARSGRQASVAIAHDEDLLVWLPGRAEP